MTGLGLMEPSSDVPGCARTSNVSRPMPGKAITPEISQNRRLVANRHTKQARFAPWLRSNMRSCTANMRRTGRNIRSTFECMRTTSAHYGRRRNLERVFLHQLPAVLEHQVVVIIGRNQSFMSNNREWISLVRLLR
uniref:Uncharacterized protein n=1 Tax=Pseudomonas aeruginosa TaxID=287 RepID=A0A5P9WB97_PSEAI|nr:hypothetical protein pNK546KPC_0525 [Pseudomonas aeruginosa]QNI16224.1 Hypothetical protein [Pseudomonas aeruginosa]UVD63363.1 hypothetical protein LMJLGFJF_00383 [Pseudomonas aeruginosa]WBW52034.1 hypothetical protein IGGMDNGE_00110 [Pseudomonas aeruginosa]WPB12872.1 hypothetical protein XM8_contig2_00438 [Pseudomonas aeruginosa]